MTRWEIIFAHFGSSSGSARFEVMDVVFLWVITIFYRFFCLFLFSSFFVFLSL